MSAKFHLKTKAQIWNKNSKEFTECKNVLTLLMPGLVESQITWVGLAGMISRKDPNNNYYLVKMKQSL